MKRGLAFFIGFIQFCYANVAYAQVAEGQPVAVESVAAVSEGPNPEERQIVAPDTQETQDSQDSQVSQPAPAPVVQQPVAPQPAVATQAPPVQQPQVEESEPTEEEVREAESVRLHAPRSRPPVHLYGFAGASEQGPIVGVGGELRLDHVQARMSVQTGLPVIRVNLDASSDIANGTWDLHGNDQTDANVRVRLTPLQVRALLSAPEIGSGFSQSYLMLHPTLGAEVRYDSARPDQAQRLRAALYAGLGGAFGFGTDGDGTSHILAALLEVRGELEFDVSPSTAIYINAYFGQSLANLDRHVDLTALEAGIGVRQHIGAGRELDMGAVLGYDRINVSSQVRDPMSGTILERDSGETGRLMIRAGVDLDAAETAMPVEESDETTSATDARD